MRTRREKIKVRNPMSELKLDIKHWRVPDNATWSRVSEFYTCPIKYAWNSIGYENMMNFAYDEGVKIPSKQNLYTIKGVVGHDVLDGLFNATMMMDFVPFLFGFVVPSVIKNRDDAKDAFYGDYYRVKAQIDSVPKDFERVFKEEVSQTGIFKGMEKDDDYEVIYGVSLWLLYEWVMSYYGWYEQMSEFMCGEGWKVPGETEKTLTYRHYKIRADMFSIEEPSYLVDFKFGWSYSPFQLAYYKYVIDAVLDVDIGGLYALTIKEMHEIPYSPNLSVVDAADVYMEIISNKPATFQEFLRSVDFGGFNWWEFDPFTAFCRGSACHECPFQPLCEGSNFIQKQKKRIIQTV